MSAPPYMKLFWGDYHKATRHLSRSQHGAYFLLLGETWRLGGALPDDDELLAKWALCTAPEWAEMRAVILGFFIFRRGKFVHDRVRQELARYESTSRQRKEAGKRGGLVKTGKHSENTEAIANQKPIKPEPEPEPEPYIEEGIEPSSLLIASPMSFQDFWNAYPRKVGKGAAEKAFQTACRKIGGADPPSALMAALDLVRSGWTDPQFIPHPATWLNQRRWEDEPTLPLNGHANGTPPPSAKFLARQANLERSFAGAQRAALRRTQQ